MGRTDKQRKKEKQFKQGMRQRLVSARQDAAEMERAREEARERGLMLTSFEITHEAMPDPLVEALPAVDRTEIDHISTGVLEHPARYRARLEALIAKHPHIPTLWNWMMSSVSRADDHERADELAAEIHQRFPDYLFGVAQFVMTLLQQDRVEEATRVLDGRLGLTAWWPERKKYHATEFVSFNAMLGCYFVATGRRKEAGTHLNMIRDILPDHPGVQALENRIILDAVRMLSERILKGREEPMVELPMSRPPRVLGMAGAARE